MKRWLSPLNTVVLTQFLSAFADNLNFFLIVGMVKRQGVDNPDIAVNYIQIAFLAAYVVLAPIVGAFADKKAKSNVLLLGNVLKAVGIALLLFGLPPALCFIFVGIGAVVYSPGKYGILTELTNTEDELLRANAKVEGSTILAILLGTVAGGFLAQNSDLPAVLTCLGVYLLSLFMSLLIPARAGNANLRYGREAMQFLRDFGTMFRNPRARFSLIGTGSFWLTAAVLRIALIAWLPLNLGITDTDQQSMMIGITAIGVVFSAFLTPKLVPAGKLHRAFFYGLFMVASVMLATVTYELWLTIILLFLIGIFGGIFVIPLNTMLQEEGKSTIGSGKTIAVQNFSENILTVSGLTIYLTLSQMDVSVNGSVIGIGLVLLLFILFLATQLPGITGAGRRKRNAGRKQAS
ncbi:lysophospholipid transporter LplT [Paenibacillus sacheonensis]|uniref:Lysophospholipid transporter LplT n=1 Tax=Paenibacillus sacheonensis TaxID=742054 RepID=A0A7X5C2A6_9BACL|nr:lysophospholipid transporter LplT [Paenibacillus sacheonensis]MBM7563619.1 LPLT family lysophospholipid transporter-like MFS transporter [Paenibacillus sacheonensis]NBC71085.1 lysophospholipid transporter LplT [Paenibacillus sacheonensis]